MVESSFVDTQFEALKFVGELESTSSILAFEDDVITERFLLLHRSNQIKQQSQYRIQSQ